MADVRLAIAGAGGRMGRALIEAALASDGFRVTAALDVPGSPALGRDAGEHCGRTTGVCVGSDVDAALQAADVLIDFTRPDGTMAHAPACARLGVAAVVGTTGLSAAQKSELAALAGNVPMVLAANMSVGVNVLLSLVEAAARTLGPDYDVEIVEMHHRLRRVARWRRRGRAHGDFRGERRARRTRASRDVAQEFCGRGAARGRIRRRSAHRTRHRSLRHAGCPRPALIAGAQG